MTARQRGFKLILKDIFWWRQHCNQTQLSVLNDLDDSSLIASDSFLFYMNINYQSVLPIIKEYVPCGYMAQKKEDSSLILANNSIQCWLEGPPLLRFHS